MMETPVSAPANPISLLMRWRHTHLTRFLIQCALCAKVAQKGQAHPNARSDKGDVSCCSAVRAHEGPSGGSACSRTSSISDGERRARLYTRWRAPVRPSRPARGFVGVPMSVGSPSRAQHHHQRLHQMTARLEGGPSCSMSAYAAMSSSHGSRNPELAPPTTCRRTRSRGRSRSPRRSQVPPAAPGPGQLGCSE